MSAKPLRWMREVLGRSPGREQATAPAGTGADSRRRAGAEPPLSAVMQQCAELGSRLLVHDPATQAVRNLVIVHDELRSIGWAGVEALPIKVVGRALSEAEMLARDEPSEVLATVIDTLRALHVIAEGNAAHEALERELERAGTPEVSETNYDEYELMERSWMGTVPSGLRAPGQTV